MLIHRVVCRRIRELIMWPLGVALNGISGGERYSFGIDLILSLAGACMLVVPLVVYRFVGSSLLLSLVSLGGLYLFFGLVYLHYERSWRKGG